MKAKIVIKVTYSIHKKKKDTRMYLAYVLIVSNYNERPHTFFLNEDLKMFFIRVLKDLSFQEEKMSKRSPNSIFLQRGERNKVS